MTVRSVNDGPVELVPLDQLREHPSNPNEGADLATGDAIEANGWYGAVIVQRSTGYLLAGHTRVRQLRAKGATHVDVQYVAVDDAAAERILLADNRTNRLGRDNEAAVAAMLSAIVERGGTLVGTGYTNEAHQLLIYHVASGGGPDDDDDPHAGTLLDRLDVEVSPPRHEVVPGDVYQLGDQHVLAVVDVFTGWPTWAPLLTEGAVFIPYPGPYVALGTKADEAPWSASPAGCRYRSA